MANWVNVKGQDFARAGSRLVFRAQGQTSPAFEELCGSRMMGCSSSGRVTSQRFHFAHR